MSGPCAGVGPASAMVTDVSVDVLVETAVRVEAPCPVLPPPTVPLDWGRQMPLWGDPVAWEQIRSPSQSESTSHRSPSPWLHPRKITSSPAQAQVGWKTKKVDRMDGWVSMGHRVCEGQKSEAC